MSNSGHRGTRIKYQAHAHHGSCGSFCGPEPWNPNTGSCFPGHLFLGFRYFWVPPAPLSSPHLFGLSGPGAFRRRRPCCSVCRSAFWDFCSTWTRRLVGWAQGVAVWCPPEAQGQRLEGQVGGTSGFSLISVCLSFTTIPLFSWTLGRRLGCSLANPKITLQPFWQMTNASKSNTRGNQIGLALVLSGTP